LAIFGSRRARLASQLKVMSIVELKSKGFYGDDKPYVEETDPDDNDWGVSFVPLQEDMLGFVLGRKGATRKKLEISSGCIIEYISKCWVVFGGTKEDQQRGIDYYSWLLDSRNNNEYKVPNLIKRNDYRIIWLPQNSVGYVTGVKANTLRQIEKASGTFCFFEKKKLPMEKMLIFSYSKKSRDIAVEEVEKIVEFHQRKVHGNGKVMYDEDYKTKKEYSDSRSKSRSVSR